MTIPYRGASTANPRRTGRKPVTLTAQELDTLAVLSVAEVAALLRITEDTVRREIKAGTLQAENYGSGRNAVYRIPREALDAWRELRRVTPRPEVK